MRAHGNEHERGPHRRRWGGSKGNRARVDKKSGRRTDREISERDWEEAVSEADADYPIDPHEGDDDQCL